MAASATDYFMEVGKPGTATTLAAPGHTIGGTSITVASTTNWPTGTGVTFAIDTVTVAGDSSTQVAGTYTVWRGVVTSATTIGSMVLSADSPNSDQNYSAGSLTRVYITVSAAHTNRTMQGILTHADQDGTLKSGAVDVTAVVADSILTKAKLDTNMNTELNTGWVSSVLPAVSSVTYNGNRSYDITFASSVASILSSGMRLRTTRTSAAPTQCTSLNGTTQYYNRTGTITGISFTDTFSCAAWIKLNSYNGAQNTIIRRGDATSGWVFDVESTGQLLILGFNAAAFRGLTTYQSVPLNKWVHVAMTMTMSTGTATAYIDGVSVPVGNFAGSTAITSLTNSGNLGVGATSTGTLPFNGKIAQVSVHSAVLSAATVKAMSTQTISASTTSIVAGYTFDGVITDVTANANNLTANGSAVATNADSPFGNAGTSSTLDYALVQSVSTTTATVQVPEGCTIPTSGGVTSVAYSVQGNPFGWVSDKGRWEVVTLYRTTIVQASATTAVVYNPAGVAITVPVGAFQVGFEVQATGTGSTGVDKNLEVQLSTSSSSITLDDLYTEFFNTVFVIRGTFARNNYRANFTAATPLYLLFRLNGAGTLSSVGIVNTNQSKVYALPTGL